MATQNIKQAAEEQKESLEEGYEQAEKENEIPTAEIEALGKTFNVPSIAPEWVQLFVARYGRGDQREVPPEKYMDFLCKVLGDEMIDHLLSEMNNSTPQGTLENVVQKILNVWLPKDAKKKK